MNIMVCLAGFAVLISVSARAQQPGLTPEQMQAMQKALGAIAAAGQQGAKPVVDFREMKALLPAELPGGFKAAEGYPKGRKTAAMGMTIAEAEGSYEKGDNTITIKLSDISGTGGMGMMAHAAWASVAIDNEDDDGYERTTTIDGQKALEKYNTKDKDGEVQVFVDNRFIVEVKGQGVTMDDLKAAIKAVDLKKLVALKPKAAAPAQ